MDASLQSRLRELGDLELALLVSMVAEEHCIFSVAGYDTKILQEELRLSCVKTFALQPVVVNCSPKTTVDEFNEAILVDGEDPLEEDVKPSVDVSSRGPSPGRIGSVVTLDTRQIANVIIATGLDTADDSVQVQAFELLSSGRIFTRSSMHQAPKNLLFVAVLSKPGARLYRHLNDRFAVSHFHTKDDGLPHLERQSHSRGSVIFLPSDITHLRDLTDKVSLTAEMAQYLHNVVIFLRNSRYVKGGVTATASRQMRILSRALAPLHGLNYVPPSLVALAARKIYPHRLILATPENERSLLWGSDPEAIKEVFEGVRVEDVIEEVLLSIEAPL